MRVLIADDQPSVRSAISLLLEQNQMSVAGVVANTDEMLEWLNTNSADIILLDWDLPGQRAEKTLSQLRSKYPSLRIIVLSSVPQTLQTALRAGADGFVCEGEPPEYLLSTIENCCSRRHSGKPESESGENGTKRRRK